MRKPKRIAEAQREQQYTLDKWRGRFCLLLGFLGAILAQDVAVFLIAFIVWVILMLDRYMVYGK